jgi:hypothetical protein
MNISKCSSARWESSGCGALRREDGLSGPQPALSADLSRQRMRFLAPKI